MSSSIMFDRRYFVVFLLIYWISLVDGDLTAIIQYNYFTPLSNYSVSLEKNETNGLLSSQSSQYPVPYGRAFVLVDAFGKYDACQTPINATIVFRGIAIIHRGGNCTFSVKITRAQQFGASAVIIYDPQATSQSTLTMAQNNSDLVSIFVQQWFGDTLFNLAIDSRTVLNISIKPIDNEDSGSSGNNPWYGTRSATIFIIVSISVLVLLCLLWFSFYYCQRYRTRTAKDRLQSRLTNAAKKAIGKIKLITIAADQNFEEPCVICLDTMKTGDLVRQLVCSHSFHQVCVDPWLLNHRHCPLCNLDILAAYRVSISGRNRRNSVAPETGRVSHVHVVLPDSLASPIETNPIDIPLNHIPTISATIHDDGVRIVALHDEQNSN